jgi:5-methylcytosine-specific restriction protein A
LRLPDTRPDSTKRGYTHRWKRFAKSFLAQNPLCLHCEQRNRTTLATLVDHIVPVSEAGEADPNFYRNGNHQPLCRRCHAVKTAQDIKNGQTR